MLENTSQFHSVNLGITVSSQMHPISLSFGKKFTDGENVCITQGIACFATISCANSSSQNTARI